MTGFPAPRPQAAALAVGDTAYPNGFPHLRALVTEVTPREDGGFAYKAEWLVTARGSGSLQARKGWTTRFSQDAYGNTTGQRVG